MPVRDRTPVKQAKPVKHIHRVHVTQMPVNAANAKTGAHVKPRTPVKQSHVTR